MKREILRQLVHFGMCGWALLFPWTGKAGAVALAALAVVFNAFVLPRLPFGRRMRRESEGTWTGVQWYPLSVLGLVLVLPLPLAAGAWGILASGDAASNLAGRTFGRRKLPWNRDKSWIGSAAFVLAAAPVALFLVGWNLGSEGGEALAPWVLPAILASLAAAAVESLPLPLDDNLTVAIAAGAALGIAAGLRA
jgi:dolichol kinase